MPSKGVTYLVRRQNMLKGTLKSKAFEIREQI